MSKNRVEALLQGYIDDEYLVHSVFLCMVSVFSFYPILYLLNKNENSKLGKRMFDQMMIYAIMGITFAHFMSEQNTFKDYCFIPLENWHKLLNVFLLIE
jgi:hypothetical protein